MKLTAQGIIKINGHNVIRTDDGRWSISIPDRRGSTHVGYVDLLSDVETFLVRRKEAIIARLADVERRHAEQLAKKAEIAEATKS